MNPRKEIGATQVRILLTYLAHSCELYSSHAGLAPHIFPEVARAFGWPFRPPDVGEMLQYEL